MNEQNKGLAFSLTIMTGPELRDGWRFGGPRPSSRKDLRASVWGCKFQLADDAFSLAFQTGPLVRSVSFVRHPSYLGCCVLLPRNVESNLNAFETFLSGIWIFILPHLFKLDTQHWKFESLKFSIFPFCLESKPNLTAAVLLWFKDVVSVCCSEHVNWILCSCGHPS